VQKSEAGLPKDTIVGDMPGKLVLRPRLTITSSEAEKALLKQKVKVLALRDFSANLGVGAWVAPAQPPTFVSAGALPASPCA
jgi:hypothetical protein